MHSTRLHHCSLPSLTPLPSPPSPLLFSLGASTDLGEAHGPVGYDLHSYGFRDIGGVRIHQSVRATYGQSRAYGPGDVIGVLVDFETPTAEIAAGEARDQGASAGPSDGERQVRAVAAAAAGASRAEIEAILYSTAPPVRLAEGLGGGAGAGAGGAGAGVSTTVAPATLLPPNGKHAVMRRSWGSSIRFFVNGEDQGIAFVHLTKEARIHAAASVYGGGAVRLNAGPTFAFYPDAAYFPRATPVLPAVIDLLAAAAVAAAATATDSLLTQQQSSSTLSAAAKPIGPPRSSLWRSLSECAEAPLPGGLMRSTTDGIAPLVSGTVATSSLAGSGLMRNVTAGRGGYNFAGTAFAYKAEQPLLPEKKSRRR